MGRERVSLDDAAWLHMDSPTNHMVVGTLVRLAGRIGAERVAALVGERLVSRFPRLRQRVVHRGLTLGTPWWEADPDFRLDHHLQRHQVGDDDGLRGMLGVEAGEALDPGRPRWRLHVIESPSGTDLYLRSHHSLADGLALVQVVLALADPPPNGGLHPGQLELAPLGRRSRSWLSPTTDALTGARVYRKLGSLADQQNPWRGVLTGTKFLGWTSAVDVAVAKRVAAASGATINDLALAVVAGAARRCFAATGRTPDRIGVTVPFNLRSLDEPLTPMLGNQLGLVFVNLPVGVDDPVERLHHLRARMASIKASPEGAIVRSGMAMVGAITQRRVARAWMQVFTRKSTAIVTNIVGPACPLRLDDVPVESFMLWVPTSGSVGVGVSIVTDMGSLRLGVQVDRGVVPDPDGLIQALDAELADLDRYAPT